MVAEPRADARRHARAPSPFARTSDPSSHRHEPLSTVSMQPFNFKRTACTFGVLSTRPYCALSCHPRVIYMAVSTGVLVLLGPLFRLSLAPLEALQVGDERSKLAEVKFAIGVRVVPLENEHHLLRSERQPQRLKRPPELLDPLNVP